MACKCMIVICTSHSTASRSTNHKVSREDQSHSAMLLGEVLFALTCLRNEQDHIEFLRLVFTGVVSQANAIVWNDYEWRKSGAGAIAPLPPQAFGAQSPYGICAVSSGLPSDDECTEGRLL